MEIVSGGKICVSNLSLTKPKILDKITVAIIITAPDKIDVCLE